MVEILCAEKCQMLIEIVTRSLFIKKIRNGTDTELLLFGVLLSALLTTNVGASTCDLTTHFLCTNFNCVLFSKLNNSLDDCGDNSDEENLCTFKIDDPRPAQFRCSNGICIPMWYRNDGTADCNFGDDSDEAKTLGTPCPYVGDNDCCPCNKYVAESECANERDGKYCACRAGYYGNENGTLCTRRKIGDGCTADADCYDVIAHASCLDRKCNCSQGYYLSPDNSDECIKQQLGGACLKDVDCSKAILNSRCQDLVCLCAQHYHPSEDGSYCLEVAECGLACSKPWAVVLIVFVVTLLFTLLLGYLLYKYLKRIISRMAARGDDPNNYPRYIPKFLLKRLQTAVSPFYAGQPISMHVEPEVPKMYRDVNMKEPEDITVNADSAGNPDVSSFPESSEYVSKRNGSIASNPSVFFRRMMNKVFPQNLST